MRILAAILFTDIEGFTALMQRDEELCLHFLARQKKIIDAVLPEYEGRLLKFIGDGSLIMFPSALQAVRCAVALQKELREDPTIPVRMGIHQGDVLLEDGDIIGDAVNTASRIQTAGIAGSVLLSDKVADEIRNHPEFRTKLLGKFQLKNIAEPVPVYAVMAEGLTVPDTLFHKPIDTVNGNSKKSPIPVLFEKFKFQPLVVFLAILVIAFIFVLVRYLVQTNSISTHAKNIGVMPFRNVSNQPEDDYLAEELTDEMISLLCTSQDLKIKKISREAIVNQSESTMMSWFHEFQIGSVLEGRVQRKENRLWVFAQLRNPYTNEIIWAKTYDNKDLRDLMDVQEELALRIVSAVKSNLSPMEKSRLDHRPTQNPDAYALYIQGRYAQNKRTLASLREAIEIFRQALRLDSNYALAWSGISDNFSLQVDNGFLPCDSGIAPARKALYMALSLDSTLAEVYASKAIFLSSLQGQHHQALGELQKALSLKPNYAAAHQWYAVELSVEGRFDEALFQINQALELEPLSERISQLKGFILKLSRDYVHAINWQDSLVRIFPENIYFNRQKAECYFRLGKKDSAIHYAAAISEPPPYDALFWISVINADASKLESHFADLQALHLLQREDRSIYLTYLHKREMALNELESAFANKEYSWLKFLGVSPTWDALRNEPRFAKLVASLNP